MRRSSAITWWIIVFLMISLLTDCFPRTSQQGGSLSNYLLLDSPFPTANPQSPPKTNEPETRRQKALSVYCHDEAIEVVINTDLFAKGLPVYAEELWLGQKSSFNNVSPASCGAVQTGQSELTVMARFKDCGTKLSITEDFLIYSNVLVYSPLLSPDGVLHKNGVVVPVQCQYQRWYNVDSVAVAPTWVPFASTFLDTDFLDFHLRLMTDDWQYERGSNVYFLGNAIHLQASVALANHLPLLLFIDWCVATPTFGEVVSEVKYSFIDHGCLVDSSASYSHSKFLQRTEGNKLNLLLDAFRFHKLTSNLVFITCSLKAVPAVNSVSAQNRACSLIDGRWQSVDGNDEVCNSCEPSKQGVAESEPIMPFYITPTPTPLVKPPHLVQNTGPGDFEVRPSQPLEPFRTSIQSEQYAYGSMSKRGADLNKDRIATLGPLFLIPKQETTTESTVHPPFGPSEVFSTSVTEEPVFNSSENSPMADQLENAISEIGNFSLSEDDLYLDDSDLYGSEEGSGVE